MKKIKQLLVLAVVSTVLISSCNLIGMSSQEKILTSHPWKLDANATVKDATNTIKDASGIDANINVEDGVKMVLDLVTETIIFTNEKDEKSGEYKYTSKRGSKLISYEKKGTWKYDSDKKTITLTLESNSPVTYEVVSLTDEKFVMKAKNSPANYVYLPAK